MSDAPVSQADVQATIAQLWIYPVKSCAGMPVTEAELTPTGLAWDRAWMVVDAAGRFVTQRELPRMVLIQPAFRMGQLVLRAPGMRSVVTELFFENTEYVDNDAVFGVRRSLIAKVEPYKADKSGNLPLARTPDAMINFDFVLAPAD